MDLKYDVKRAITQFGFQVAHRGAFYCLWATGKDNFTEQMTSELDYGAKQETLM